jgi:hypothetical protein
LSSFFFSSFSYSNAPANKIFSLDGVTQKKERRRLITNPLLPFFLLRFSQLFLILFLSLFSYDLPPFFATLDFVDLLEDASPFLLDFFLVAIIS